MVWKAFRAAFPHTIPIFAGFWFLGMAYGIYMNALGFSFVYPALMALFIFGGSLEFVAGSMLVASFAPVQALLLALIIQARHLFYGIAMLDRFRGLGWKRPYLIFGMCDETFSINYAADIPQDVDRGWFMFFVTLLNQVYWVSGAALGGLLGGVLPFDTTGVEFAMTALFLVIFLEQWLKERQHITALIGLGATIACRLVFPVDSFLIPTMIVILVALTLLRRPIERRAIERKSLRKAGASV
ncbi:AzlC family ABC transporter permease [Selenomonas sp.]|uniref:AzlC family ABC transporter permease n=1 Tax=Selenomonas sp. TaxID=2053611 RepID=UPI0025FF4712|nr:AzlC family ABC transporter permease [Selenomonas sp.]MCI6085150.1 AzlC family ABC transporter permease [Selenomonas sp.]MDY3298124.1 AzlC family ABC transporter permease [Selenomonas sp.]MDY4415983.1 AzlC family ABC transporter permease [Selenomonas sp.]